MTTTPRAASQDAMPRRSLLAWALRRAAIGVLILFAAVAAFAWLLHASIEDDESTVAAATPPAQASPGAMLSFSASRSPRL
jgi:hypothetical protein